MIASLRGRVASVRLDAVVVEVGGVGLLAYATPTTLAGLRVGDEARLASTLVVREDSLTLYAFTDDDERDVFETVQTVSGVGPRLALAMLAVHTPDALRRAVADEDLAALQRVPGIGRKGAQRIVLELADRLGAPAPAAAGGAQPSAAAGDQRGQVVEALVGLGWNVRAAEDAVARVVPTEVAVEADDVAAVLRGALRVLGGARG
ncbi:Holliday junction branch migration protein RuvA [Cellulomonas carbonis]|uniref:Holliday junction branch migration complex subunit RuvA n=1 Tax=Cellulomonas carbonis T26 TaxID=947969 RepID=A0A0A0BVS9_9CELL|nr:Holliday junction branch migration protein RuvA [Cellulomonas carbonis]KGM12513.1 ATP-dependent DNA helicase RuvA [Cellulomonas carbonis T26]GGB93852.1 Holliday junction ATP-dependent DNA helicase RuvA [Cellulomonas carbonis]